MRLLWVGLALALVAHVLYGLQGFHLPFVVLWLAGLGVSGAHYYKRRARRNRSARFDGYDALTAVLLCVALAPPYTLFLEKIPLLVNTDEVVDLWVASSEIRQRPLNLLGVTPGYFYFPASIYALRGWLCERLGGIDLARMRSVSALLGLAAVTLFYGVLRLAGSRRFALAGAIFLGTQFVFWTFSRMALPTNTVIGFEIAALGFLLIGQRRGCPFYSFCGGVAAGLGFHGYQTTRAIVAVWICFLGLWSWLKRGQPKETRYPWAAAGLGLLLVAGPVIVSTWRHAPQSTQWMRDIVMVYPEARKLAQLWAGGAPMPEAVRSNTRRWFQVFNKRPADHAWEYSGYSRGFGFVDPATGLLLWIGCLVVLWRMRRGTATDGEVLFLSGFFVIWLLCFLLNKAPNYACLIGILPFVIFVSLKALEAIARGIAWRLSRFGDGWAIQGERLLFGGGAAVLALYNMFIFQTITTNALREGHPLGNTAQHVETRRSPPGYFYYLIADTQYPYYGGAEGPEWIRSFAGPGQAAEKLSPRAWAAHPLKAPFSAFMNRTLWRESKTEWLGRHPRLRFYDITPDGGLVAVEVLPEG